MAERIIAAAIYAGGIITLPPPARHGTIIETMDLQMGIPGTNALPYLQGFITDTARFVNRSEAFGIAYRSGQISGRSNSTPQLYSEDLW
jgi:fucose permease